MKKFLLIFACLMTGIPLTYSQRVFTVSELLQDLSVIKSALQEAHAGTYRYTDSNLFESRFKSLKKSISRPMNELEFFRIVNPFFASLQDGHTKFHSAGRPDDLFAFAEKGYFPVPLYFSADRAHAMANVNSIPVGAELLTIDSRSLKEIQTVLFKNMLVDGTGLSMKYEFINDNFAGYYGAFIATPSSFSVRYRFKGKTYQKSIPSVAAQVVQKPIVKEQLYAVKFIGKTAVMRISGFQSEPDGPGFETFLLETFKKINDIGISKLILDLRNNEGGMDAYGIKLYSYLSDKPFQYYDRFTVAGLPKYSFAKYAFIPPELEHLKQFIKKSGLEYQFSKKDGLGMQSNDSLSYKGKLIILINGKSFSVTSEFASIAKDNERAVFIGDDTGGAAEGNTSGTFVFVQLPNSKLELAIPLLAYHMHLSKRPIKGTGIRPDFRIIPSLSQILEGKDPVMDRALSIP